MKTKNMTFTEAVQAAKNGHKIRQAGWRPPCYLYFVTDKFTDEEDRAFSRLYRDDFLADDWEIVPEPPKTMTFTEAIEKSEGGTPVQRIGWNDLCVMFGTEGEDQCPLKMSIIDKAYTGDSLTYDDIAATDWIVVTEEPNDD
jgi:hypothetical protein